MKVIVAGSRSIYNIEFIEQAIKSSEFPIDEIVCGCAPGVDRVAGHIIASRDKIPVRHFPAYGVHPLRRNEIMADYADALVAVWDGYSRGTMHMMRQMRLRGKLLFTQTYRTFPLAEKSSQVST